MRGGVGRGSRRVLLEMPQKPVRELSGQGSQLHVEKLSLATAGGGACVQGPWEPGGDRAHGRNRGLSWKSH